MKHNRRAIKKNNQKNLKQSWLPAFWKKIQNIQEIIRTLFNNMEQDNIFFFLFRIIKKGSFSLLSVLDPEEQ